MPTIQSTVHAHDLLGPEHDCAACPAHALLPSSMPAPSKWRCASCGHVWFRSFAIAGSVHWWPLDHGPACTALWDCAAGDDLEPVSESALATLARGEDAILVSVLDYV